MPFHTERMPATRSTFPLPKWGARLVSTQVAITRMSAYGVALQRAVFLWHVSEMVR